MYVCVCVISCPPHIYYVLLDKFIASCILLLLESSIAGLFVRIAGTAPVREVVCEYFLLTFFVFADVYNDANIRTCDNSSKVEV